MECARVMVKDDWLDLGLSEALAEKVQASLGHDRIVLRITIDGEVIELAARPADSVGAIMERLENELGVDVENMRLWIGDTRRARRKRPLLSDETLFESGIRADVDLALRRRRTPAQGVPFNVYVKDGGTGGTHGVTVESCFTLRALIHHVLDKKGVTVEEDWRWRIEYYGAYLFATETLLDFVDVGRDDTMFLVRRMLA